MIHRAEQFFKKRTCPEDDLLLSFYSDLAFWDMRWRPITWGHVGWDRSLGPTSCLFFDYWLCRIPWVDMWRSKDMKRRCSLETGMKSVGRIVLRMAQSFYCHQQERLQLSKNQTPKRPGSGHPFRISGIEPLHCRAKRGRQRRGPGSLGLGSWASK